MTHPPRALKGLFALLIILILGTLIVAGTMAIRAMGRIDEVESASRDLNVRNVRFTPAFRSHIYRIQAAALRARVSGDPAEIAHFDFLKKEFEGFLDSRREMFTHDNEEKILGDLDSKLALYFKELRPVSSAPTEGSDEKRFENRERIQDLRDEIIEMAQRLGANRQEAFSSSLEEYQSLIDTIKHAIVIALGVLVVSLVIMAWLARWAFLEPIEVSLRQAQETVSSTSNLATIGTLAAGVAHEIRNPITAIKARLFALGEGAREDESMLRQVSAIQTETNRMEKIVQDFLNFARPTESHLEQENTADLLDAIHSLVLPEMESRGVSLLIGRTVEALVRVDKDQLTQVFQNLIRNAAEACPETGGEVILSSALEGNQVILAVSDNGKGIPEEYLGKIFNPFFSKKKGGTGLGLAICRNLIENQCGTLTCDSIEGHGSTFSIRLDVA